MALVLIAEIAVRILGVEPRPWPTVGEQRDFDGVRVDPLLGPLPVPGWSGRWFGEFEARFDERGFRTTDGGPGSGKRVVFVGDSCMFAWGVDTAETFLARLEEIARRRGAGPFELRNAAYPGSSAVSGVYFLRERVLPLRPDVVVIGFSANNAFRFALASDADRFRAYGLRKTLLRSRLFRIAAAWMANRQAARAHPRDRRAVGAEPVRALSRVASAGEFEAALRTLVAESRAAGAAPVFVIFPRAALVSTRWDYEDAARAAAGKARSGRPPEAATGRPEVDLLELSCLDPRELADPAGALRAASPAWRPVFPDAEALRALLGRGAAAYARGERMEAARIFAAAVAADADSPLARYDRGAALLSLGDAAGARDLEEASRLACGVFLLYQTRVWRVASELGVPVVDLTLHLQALPDAGAAFLDPAHLNAAGQSLLAEALWPALAGVPEKSSGAQPSLRGSNGSS